MKKVMCHYCGNPAILTDSRVLYGKSYGMIWLCRGCDAWVGTHENSRKCKPKGTLANKELRWWRRQAHEAFDDLWKSPRGITRMEAYCFLQEVMGLTFNNAHIAKFDIDQCKKLIKILSDRGLR